MFGHILQMLLAVVLLINQFLCLQQNCVNRPIYFEPLEDYK